MIPRNQWFLRSLVGLGLFTAWVTFYFIENKRVVPSERVRTFDEYLREMPTPENVQSAEWEGEEYLYASGPMRSVFTFPSGPPVYVFDRTGALIDWTGDAGDDTQFNLRWPSAERGRRISIEDARLWIAEPKG